MGKSRHVSKPGVFDTPGRYAEDPAATPAASWPVRCGEVAVPCRDRRLGVQAEALLVSRCASRSGTRGRCEGCYGGRELRDAVRGELARELLPKLLRVLLRRLSGDLREIRVWEPQSRKTG